MPALTPVERLAKASDGLSQAEQLDLLERLIHKLRKTAIPKKRKVEGRRLYGLGKGVWEEDAQDYVNRLREERL